MPDFASFPWLDVCVLRIPQTPSAWWAQCEESLRVAIAQAGFPITLHVIDGEYGHLGRSRARAYALGLAPYVTQVDDDDYVLPHAFSQLMVPLTARAEAIFPAEWQLPIAADDTALPMKRGQQRHSMKVFRRSLLIDHRPWAWACEIAQLAALERYAVHVVDLPEPSYVWRVRSNSPSLPLRLQYPHELSIARRGPPFVFPDG